jgi:hypothetical protein
MSGDSGYPSCWRCRARMRECSGMYLAGRPRSTCVLRVGAFRPRLGVFACRSRVLGEVRVQVVERVVEAGTMGLDLQQSLMVADRVVEASQALASGEVWGVAMLV